MKDQWVLIIILIVVLILFGRPFFDEFAMGLSESIDNFMAGIRGKPRRQDGDYSSYWLLLVLTLIAVAIILSVLSQMYFPLNHQ